MSRPLLIGLAGGIGAGKSAVAEAFARAGAWVSNSDAEARAALASPAVRDTVVSWWGPGVLGTDGLPDRQKIAGVVFGDPEQRRRLEGLLHPMVHQARAEMVRRASAQGVAAVIVDAPLLFEAGVDADCDAVVFVDVPREQRLARVLASRGWTEEEFDRRERAQLPVEEKRRRSDYVLHNSGDRAEMAAAAAELLDRITRDAQSADSQRLGSRRNKEDA